MSVHTITVGRVGLDIPLRVPAEGAWSDGVGMKISGTLGAEAGYSLEESVALFHQFNGLVNADERVVPCTFAATPSLDGFYEVGAASVKTDGASWATGAFDYDLTLHRVRGSSRPVVDVKSLAVYRTGYAVAAVSCSVMYGAPSAASDLTFIPYATTANVTRTADTGAVTVKGYSAAFSTFSFRPAAADWYDGACKVEVTFDGSTWFTVTGGQIPAGITSWRLNNGLVRVVPSATAGRIDVQHYDGSTWETAKTYRLTISSSTGVVDLVGAPVVLRNAPHIAALKMTISGSAAGVGPSTLTLTVRRGDRFLYGVIQGLQNTGGGVRRDTAEAATSASGGLAATANDASGNRYVLASNAATTKDTANGGLSISPGYTVDFGIGSAIGGSAAVSGDTTAELLSQYGFWNAENPRVVIP